MRFKPKMHVGASKSSINSVGFPHALDFMRAKYQTLDNLWKVRPQALEPVGDPCIIAGGVQESKHKVCINLADALQYSLS